jgi:uncharacterized protein (TIGR00730 family)
MGVAADACMAAGGKVIGVIPRLLMDKEVGHHGLTEMHVVANMHERKALMTELTDGFIALPGGYGTLDELFEVLTLVQTERIPQFPLILFGSDYWDGLWKWAKTQMQDKNKYITPGDLDLFKIVDDPDEAVKIILDYERHAGTPALPQAFA